MDYVRKEKTMRKTPKVCVDCRKNAKFSACSVGELSPVASRRLNEIDEMNIGCPLRPVNLQLLGGVLVHKLTQAFSE